MELWPEIRARARGLEGRAGHFESDLKKYVEFRRACDNIDLDVEDVDFEEFMAFLDLEHFLGLRGSDTWSDDGNESQVVVKTLIAHILTERTPAKDQLPQIYYDFATALEPTDYVLTFNYDILLERALEEVGKPFRLFPDRYEEVRTSHAVVDHEKEEVVLLKLHGSVDWFDRRRYADLEASFDEHGAKSRPSHPVFGPESEVSTVRLLDGPRFPDDPLRDMHRVLEPDVLYEKDILFLATPWLMSPSTAKVVYANKLKDFWRGLGRAGGWNLGVVVIGYSLPEHDDYARHALYALIRNYQESWWDQEFLDGLRKQPVLLVDRKLEPEREAAYRKRYGFVIPEKAVYHLTGFDDAAVDLIRNGG